MFEFLFDPRYYPDILQGLSLTVEITLFGVALGLLIGTLLAIGDIYGGKLVKGAIAVYVEFFRGSPLDPPLAGITARTSMELHTFSGRSPTLPDDLIISQSTGPVQPAEA